MPVVSNDILTGATSNEPQGETRTPSTPTAAGPASATADVAADPATAPTDMTPMLTCANCRQAFPASQAIVGRCRNCRPNIDAALHDMRGDKADYTDYAAQERDSETAWKLVSMVIAIVIAIAWAFFKFGMRNSE
jgi:hypothetical protein